VKLSGSTIRSCALVVARKKNSSANSAQHLRLFSTMVGALMSIAIMALAGGREWISQHRIGGFPISGVALVVAVIAAGDVLFSDPGEPGLSIGLQFGGGGTPSRDWWKRVIGGALLEPTPPLHPAPLPAPSKIVRSAV